MIVLLLGATHEGTRGRYMGPLACACFASLVGCGCGDRGTAGADAGTADGVDAVGLDAQPDGALTCTAAGSPDPAFGVGGVVPIFGLRPDEAAIADAVMIDSMSRIVVAGGFIAGPRSCVIARLLPDGSRDPSFGANGVVRGSVEDRVCWYNDLAIQADGKIVAFGEIDGHTSPRGVIARYMTNGERDQTFGDGGVVVFAPSPATSGMAIALDAQERILVAGDAESVFYARRFLPDGSIDSSFGTNGIAEQAFGLGFDVALDVNVDLDGKIVVVGSIASSPESAGAAGIVRYRSDGTKDATFGVMGQIILNGWGAGGIVFDATERPLIAGSSDHGGVLARLMPDGSLDSTFGVNGMVDETGKPGLAYGKTMFAPGGLFAFGQSLAGMGSSVELARYDSNGVLDPMFGSNGFANALPINARERGGGLALQPDGRIVIVGGYGGLDSFDMFVARYCP